MFHFLFIGFSLTMGIGLAILLLTNLSPIVHKIRSLTRSALITIRSVFCTALILFGLAAIYVSLTDPRMVWPQLLAPLGGAILMTVSGIFWGLHPPKR